MTPQLMTQAEFALYRGVQKSAVSKWKKAGLLVFAEDPVCQKPKIDVVRTIARLNANLDPSRGRPTAAQAAAASAPVSVPIVPVAPAPPHDNGLANARAELLRHQVTSKALDNATRAGELVSLAEFERLAMENGRVTRERMIAVMRSNAERIAAEREPRAVVALLTDEIDQAFKELAEALIATGGENDDDAVAVMESAEADLLVEVETT